MSEIEPRNTENGTGANGISIVARGMIEASQPALDRVCAEFTEDELVLKQSTDASPDEARSVEIRAGEGETLLEFHEICGERGLGFAVTWLSHQ